MSTNERTPTTLRPFFEWIRKGIVSVKSIRIRVIRLDNVGFEGYGGTEKRRERVCVSVRGEERERERKRESNCVDVCKCVCPPGRSFLCTCHERKTKGRSSGRNGLVSSSKQADLARLIIRASFVLSFPVDLRIPERSVGSRHCSRRKVVRKFSSAS